MARQIEIAEWCDIQRILRETFAIWSPGLTRQRYVDFIWQQLQHAWSKANYSYVILKDKHNSPDPAASLKYYKITMAHRGQTLDFAGLGAIYTRKDMRGEGYATELILQVIDKAKAEGCHGVMLFSDIPPEFYSRFGFYDLSNEKFILSLTEVTRQESTRFEAPTSLEDGTIVWWQNLVVDGREIVVRSQYLTTRQDMIDFVERHYRRWLSGQRYGVQRSFRYFHFKIFRENYLADHSLLAWPRLEIVIVDEDDMSGYALIEYGGRIVRILELVGSESARKVLWRAVVARARHLDAVRISGWEGILEDFSPGFTLQQMATIDCELRSEFRSLMFADKVKGRCMILPLKIDIADWLTICPCPILELDHL